MASFCHKKILTNFYWITLMIFIQFCGSGETESLNYQKVNTEKLIGTPFEGLTIGDSINTMSLLCGEFRTETIDSFPIPVFAAFFNYGQEEAIQEGIQIANEAVGFEAYQYTETWSDRARVIYFVENTEFGGDGYTRSLYQNFNNKQYAEKIATDWAIQISFLPDKWTIAHELGHATGIGGHYLIDYVNDTTTDLEEYSLMAPDAGFAFLTDYNFMMSMQGQIMGNHLGEMGEIAEGLCQ